MNKSSLLNKEMKEGYTWIGVPQSIHLNNYVQIEQEIRAYLNKKEARVVLNLSKTNTIASSGLSMFMRLGRYASIHGSSLYLVNVMKRIQTLFRSIRLEDIVPVFETETEFEISIEREREHGKPRPEGKFIFTVTTKKNICRISLGGTMVAGQNIFILHDTVARQKASAFLIDMSALEMVDSHGIGVLIDTIVEINERGGHCVAFGTYGKTKDVLELLSIEGYIPFYKNETSARRALNSMLRGKKS